MSHKCRGDILLRGYPRHRTFPKPTPNSGMNVSYTEIACAIERVAPAMQAVLTKHEKDRSAAQETFEAPLVMQIDDR